MSELENVFTKGTQGFIPSENLVLKPLNEDYNFVAKIKSISPLTINKIWDVEQTKDFSANIKHFDGTSISNDEVQENQFVHVSRMPDNQFLGLMKNTSSFSGIGAYIYCIGEAFEKSEYTGFFYCGIYGKTWKKTNLKVLTSYKLIKGETNKLAVVSSSETPVFIDNAIDIIPSRGVVPGCSGNETGKAYPVSLIPAIWEHDGVKENCYCAISQSVLASGYVCCDSEPEPIECSDATATLLSGSFLLQVHFSQQNYQIFPTTNFVYPQLMWYPNVFRYFAPNFTEWNAWDGMLDHTIMSITLYHAVRQNNGSFWYWYGTQVTDEEYNTYFDNFFSLGVGNKITIQVKNSRGGSPYQKYIASFIYQQTVQNSENPQTWWNGTYTFMKAYSQYIVDYDNPQEWEVTAKAELDEILAELGSEITVAQGACLNVPYWSYIYY